jgi:hypothetical protein
VRLYDLEPYTHYFLDISQNNFENISWQTKIKTMNVAVSPNQLKFIVVPVTVVSEASGTVRVQDSTGTKGMGRINVCFYREDGSRAACVLTDHEGSYSYMGLTPGTYTIRIDEDQLRMLNMKATPEKTITIESSKEGTLLEDLNFTIQRNSVDAIR